MRVTLGILFAVACLSGCAKVCRPGTVLLSYDLAVSGVTVADLEVSVTVDGSSVTRVLRTSKPSASVEVRFPSGYPNGKVVGFQIVARDANGGAIAQGSVTDTLAEKCDLLDVSLGPLVDAGVIDLLNDTEPPADLAVTPDLTTEDVDMTSSDLAPDLVVPIPSCGGLPVNCGASGDVNCCTNPPIPGGTFLRGYDVPVDAFNNMGYPATVSNFRLDKYEVTVGRFRSFVAAGKGTQQGPPSSGAGAHPNITNSGWNSAWFSELVSNTAALTSAIKCSSAYQTWTDSPGSNERRPINCVTWYEAMAFCAWDGGFLPTEAEANYAASGGDEQRAFPWSVPPDAFMLDDTYAVYGCQGGTCTGTANIANVGSVSPKGDGRWGHSDLAGNLHEWVLDGYNDPFPTPCTDCANLTDTGIRLFRGGNYSSPNSSMRAALRWDGFSPTERLPEMGIRCARPAN